MAQTHSLDLEASSSQYAYVADSAALEISGDMTFEAWVKFESLPSAGGSIYIANRDPDDGSNRVWALRIVESSGQYKLGAYNSSGGTNATTTGQISSSAFDLSTATWYHLAWVFSSGNLKSYVNGSLINSAAGLNSSMYTGGSAQLTIGSYDTGVSNFFDGLIKDVRIFSDERTAAEILTDAHTQNVSDANLVGEWNFNNAYTDTSGNGNTLTSGGSPVFSTTIPWEGASDISGSTYLETNLQGFWTLDETSGTRLDSTANNNDLSDINTVGSATGKINNGASFASASSEYLKITDASQTGLDAAAGGALSFSFWYKPTNLPTTDGNPHMMVNKITSGPAGYRMFFTNEGSPADNKLKVFWWNTSNTDNSLYSSVPCVAGTWIHVVVTMDFSLGQSGIKIYFNGVQDTATTGIGNNGGTAGGNSENFSLGAVNTDATPTWFANGVMDETGLWNRKLNYGDVLDLYNGGTGITFSSVVDLTISVSDSLSLTEGVSIVQIHNVSVSDALTVTEDIAETNFYHVSVSDALTVTEDIAETNFYHVSVSDALTVTESVTATTSGPIIVVDDLLTTTESISLSHTSYVVASEALTITEDIATGASTITISVVDTTSISESVLVDVAIFVDSFDEVAITESTVCTATVAGINVSDQITLVEDYTALVSQADSYVINVSDSVTITENIATHIQSFLSVADDVSISESVAVENILCCSASESLTVTESTAATLIHGVSVQDILTITEDIVVGISSYTSITDSVSVTESISVQVISFVSPFDSLTISEDINAQLIYGVSVFDSIGVAESIGIQIVAEASSIETLSIAESVVLNLIRQVSTFDEVSVSESVNIFVGYDISISDSLSISEDVATDLISFVSVADLVTADDVPVPEKYYNVTVADQATVAEDIVTDILSSISASDTMVLDEVITTEVRSFQSVSDSLSVSDSIEVAGMLFFLVSETLSALENVSMESHRYSPQRPFTRPYTGTGSGFPFKPTSWHGSGPQARPLSGPGSGPVSFRGF